MHGLLGDAARPLSAQVPVSALHHDKDAFDQRVTVQEMTGWRHTAAYARATPLKLARSAAAEKLKLGALGGNLFKIIMRGVHGDVDADVGALRKRGHVNYYGLLSRSRNARNDGARRRLHLDPRDGRGRRAACGHAVAHAGPQATA